MHRSLPLPESRPSIPTGAWTKVTTIEPAKRTMLRVVNVDASNVFRVCLVPVGGAAPTAATAGLPLLAGSPGGAYEENTMNGTYADIYAYQASGGTLATLFVQEGK